MTVYLDTDEDMLDKVELGLTEQAIRAAQAHVPISELSTEERNRIEGVKSAGLAIAAVKQPKFHDRLNPAKVTQDPLGPVERVAAVANSHDITPSKNKPTSIYDLANAPIDYSAEADAFKNLDNGIEQLSANQALLEHELAAPFNDEAMVDYLHRSDTEVVNNYEIASKAAAPFPNLARSIMNLGLAMEKRYTEDKLTVYKKQGDECKAKIDLLLKLSAQLPKMNSADESYQLKDETKQEISRLVKELRELGIDIFPRDPADKDAPEIDQQEEFTKEQLAVASSLINHHIDTNRTTLQEIFTTKIAPAIQFLQMMIEVMKKVADLDDRQKRKALELR